MAALAALQEIQGQEIARMLPVVGGSSGAEYKYFGIEPVSIGSVVRWQVTRKVFGNPIGVFRGATRETINDTYVFNSEPQLINFGQNYNLITNAFTGREGVLYYTVSRALRGGPGTRSTPVPLPEAGGGRGENK